MYYDNRNKILKYTFLPVLKLYPYKNQLDVLEGYKVISKQKFHNKKEMSFE